MSQLVILLSAWATIQASYRLVRRFRIECFQNSGSRVGECPRIIQLIEQSAHRRPLGLAARSTPTKVQWLTQDHPSKWGASPASWSERSASSSVTKQSLDHR